MTPAAAQQPCLPGMPGLSRALGASVRGLVLGPRSSVRMFIRRARNAVEDIGACFSTGKAHDEQHDAALLNAERLVLTSMARVPMTRAAYIQQQQAILRDIKAAQAADDCEDFCLYLQGWPTARKLAGALNRALLERRGEGRS